MTIKKMLDDEEWDVISIQRAANGCQDNTIIKGCSF